MKILQFVTQMEAAGAQTQALMLQNDCKNAVITWRPFSYIKNAKPLRVFKYHLPF